MLAIDVEEANGERLRTFADLYSDYAPEVAALLSQLASEEDRHRLQLEETYQRRYGASQRTLGQPDVREVIEAHDLDDAEHLVFDSLSLRRALETVLAVERQARDFYRQAAESAVEPELKSLYQELGGFETSHVQWIEERLKEIRGPA